jgi:PAS domain-containing protein
MGVWKPVDVIGDKPSPGGPIIRSSADAASLGMAYQIEASKDGTRRFTFVGQRCQAVNGVPAEAAMADPAVLYNMVLPEHREAFAAAEAQAIALTQPFDVEVAMRRADGVVRWHRIASIPRPQPGGRVLWDGLQIDVTDRRRLASELEEQRRRVEIAVEATDMGLWEVDLQSETLTWSDRNRRLFGLSPEAPGHAADLHGSDLRRGPPDRPRGLRARAGPGRSGRLHRRVPHHDARRGGSVGVVARPDDPRR